MQVLHKSEKYVHNNKRVLNINSVVLHLMVLPNHLFYEIKERVFHFDMEKAVCR